jgi:serine phosphatase RsbU (regulator of sigma subunit)
MVRHGSLDRTRADLADSGVAFRYLAADGGSVGGDWFDVIPLPGGRAGLVVGDVSGHGRRSAALMRRVRRLVRHLVRSGGGPAEVLERINTHLLRRGGEELVSAIVAIWDPASRSLTWANAGHPPVLRCRRDETGFLAGATGPMLGVTPEPDFAEQVKILRPGTTLVLYTDGLVEHRQAALADSMVDLAVLGDRLASRGPDELCAGLLDWRLVRGSAGDDICVVAVHLD